jgi:hypothetical protein
MYTYNDDDRNFYQIKKDTKKMKEKTGFRAKLILNQLTALLLKLVALLNDRRFPCRHRFGRGNRITG